MALVTSDFNYGSVDEETATKLEYFAKTGKALIRKSQIQFIADFGKILSEARQQLSHKGDGVFIRWATAEFDFSARTIWNYVNAWEKCLCNGCTNYSHWSASALYLFASTDVPKPVQRKLQNLPATEMIRASEVKKLIDASKPKPPEDDDGEIPFGGAPEGSPSSSEDDEKAAKEKAKAEKDEAKQKAREEAKAAKAAERAAAKEAAAKEKEEAKAAAKAAREKAKEDAKKAKLAELPVSEQYKLTRELAKQFLFKAVNTVDDLNHLKKSQVCSQHDTSKLLALASSLRGKPMQIACVKLLQHVISEMLW